MMSEWVMVGLTAIYVGLTAFYAWVSHSTLKAIQEQGKSGTDQFQKQLAAMEKAQQQTDMLITLAISQVDALTRTAEATNKSAGTAKENLEAHISGERASLNILLGNVVPVTQAHAQDQTKPVLNAVSCQLENYGSTRAVVNEFRGRYLHVTTPTFALNYDDCRPLLGDQRVEDRSVGMYFLLEPNPTLTEEEVIKIREGKSTFHFYGLVRYTDVFNRRWKRTFHMQWQMRLGVILEGSVMDSWQPVGPPEQNQETEDTDFLSLTAKAS